MMVRQSASCCTHGEGKICAWCPNRYGRWALRCDHRHCQHSGHWISVHVMSDISCEPKDGRISLVGTPARVEALPMKSHAVPITHGESTLTAHASRITRRKRLTQRHELPIFAARPSAKPSASAVAIREGLESVKLLRPCIAQRRRASVPVVESSAADLLTLHTQSSGPLTRRIPAKWESLVTQSSGDKQRIARQTTRSAPTAAASQVAAQHAHVVSARHATRGAFHAYRCRVVRLPSDVMRQDRDKAGRCVGHGSVRRRQQHKARARRARRGTTQQR